MNEDNAIALATMLINSTTGWNPGAEAELVREIMTWRDHVAAETAVDQVRHTWAERSRPPLGWIVRAYNEARDARRRAEEPEHQTVHEDGIDPKRGRGVAFQAYRTSLGLPDDEATRERFAGRLRRHGVRGA